MKKFILITALLVAAFGAAAAAQQNTGRFILLSLPESVIATVVEQSLPIVVNQASNSLVGSISVTDINNLALKNDSITAAVSMQGRDVQLNTSFGGNQIRLNVGSVDLNFNAAATLRFDKESQTLFIHPTVSGLEQQENNEAGKLMLALFNDQEIPLVLDTLQPIITDIGSNELVIDTRVHDVVVKPGLIDIWLEPKTSVRNK
ncbi:MAG: hypothetical protein P8X39_11560 [Desulfofustis sp.]|jgi:hypothetical protein